MEASVATAVLKVRACDELVTYDNTLIRQPRRCCIIHTTKVLVFNCDEGIDFQSMGRIFIGLVKVSTSTFMSVPAQDAIPTQRATEFRNL